MPCATVHLLLAGRVLSDWSDAPARAPVPFRRPEVRAAFLHGALAPDMGFLPGLDRFLSELAHYHAPADLARALLTLARSPEDEAFAWGWITHVVGDVKIHPMIGRAVGEYLHGDRGRRVDAAEDVEAHVSLEVGLDVHILRSDPGIPRPPSSPRMDSAHVAHLEAALARTYGLRWDRSALLRQHRQAARMNRLWPRALQLLAPGRPGLAARLPGVGPRVLGRIASRGVASLRTVTRTGSPARGFFGARAPAAWLVEEVLGAVAGFPDQFRELVAGGLSEMPNRNLETGGEAGSDRGHPASDSVARRLAALRLGAPGSLAPELRGILRTVSGPVPPQGRPAFGHRTERISRELQLYEREEDYG